MLGNERQWQKLGKILAPDPAVPWMVSHTGASMAVPIDGGPEFDVYVTGRDARNRSHIGKVRLTLEGEPRVTSIDPAAVFAPGEDGTFDENGVSYPSMVHVGNHFYMYYVGWVPTVNTGFQNDAGLARAVAGTDDWQRVSRAPILPRTDSEPFGTGSVQVLKEGDRWRLWYTVFLRWGKGPDEHRHYYVIRHADSDDGVHWRRSEHACIGIEDPSEYAVGKPSVVKLGGTYHMWYVHRGEQYRIGYAHSQDGLEWTRRDDIAGIGVGPSSWDDTAICYPHVFQYGDALYMTYCGNEYGRGGLGLARLPL